MKYAIQVHPNCDWKTSQLQARKLCDALLLSGDDIIAVFFYGESSHIANPKCSHDWNSWDTSKAPLLVCSTLAEQMNIPCDDSNTVAVTGMARWMQLMEHADQLVIIP